MRANLTRSRVISKINYWRFPSYLLSTLLLYFLFIFYFPRCTIPDFPSVSSLPFLTCHQTATDIDNCNSDSRIIVRDMNAITKLIFVSLGIQWNSILFENKRRIVSWQNHIAINLPRYAYPLLWTYCLLWLFVWK